MPLDTASTPAKPSASHYAGRAWVLLAIVLSAFNLRTAVTSLTPLLELLGRTFSFGPSIAGVLGMLPSVCFAAFGMATPAIARRIGLERTAIVAMGLAAAGLVGRSTAGGTAGLMIGAIVALGGMGMGNVVLPPLVKRYFADRVGAVSTLYITLLQLGTILPALLAVPVAANVGWRLSMGSWSVIAAAAIVPWLVVLRWRQLDHSRQRFDADSDAGRQALPDAPVGRIWHSPVAWGMALMFGMTSLVTYSMFTWLPTLLTEAGATPAFGGTMVALFSALGLLSALGMPALAVRMRNPYALVIAATVCHLVAFAGLLLAPMTLPVLWVALLGMGPSTFPLALTLINLRTRTHDGSAALSGFMQGVGYTLSALGPLLFGVLHEATHGWTMPFAMLLAAVAVLNVGAWLACQPRMLEDTW